MLVPDDLELYDPPMPGTDDARDWLRHELVCWPYVTAPVRCFLDSLYWRQRASVTLTLGQGLTHEEAGYKLGVTERTVRRDIADVAALASTLRGQHEKN